jgi:hypothetical protein
MSSRTLFSVSSEVFNNEEGQQFSHAPSSSPQQQASTVSESVPVSAPVSIPVEPAPAAARVHTCLTFSELLRQTVQELERENAAAAAIAAAVSDQKSDIDDYEEYDSFDDEDSSDIEVIFFNRDRSFDSESESEENRATYINKRRKLRKSRRL